MVQKEITFNDGTRIFYEVSNGNVQRFIEFPLSQAEKENIIISRFLKINYEERVRKYNAGKYYYLKVLEYICFDLNTNQKIQLYNELKNLHDRTSADYDPNIRSRSFLETFGKYMPNNKPMGAAFFMTIYLAMVDYEQEKSIDPNLMGKTLVLKSCEAVILKGESYESAANLLKKKHNNVSDDNWKEFNENYTYKEYNGYNGFDDDTIDIGFDGHPEATWNVD